MRGNNLIVYSRNISTKRLPLHFVFYLKATSTFLWVILSVIAASFGHVTAAVANPTIVAILLDDLGPGEIGPLAHRSVTPNIDALAASGITFTDGYAPAPKCGPSRAGTLSMRQPQTFGFYTNQDKVSDAVWGMPDEVVTFPELLQQAGYETWLVGKSHAGANAWQHPQAMGFDHFFGFLSGEHPYLGEAAGNPIYRNLVPEAEGEYLTDAFAREVIAALQAPGDKPKFVFASLNAPHTPMQAPLHSGCAATDKRCIWLAIMRNLDDAVGRIVAALPPNSLVALAGDNGCDAADSTCSGMPTRGQKGSLYEGGVRVPFMLAWPGQFPAGKRLSQPVTTMDWGPTFLAAAGAPVPAWADGVDLLPLARGQTSKAPHANMFWGTSKSNATVRWGNWKLMGSVLYNLSKDIGEKKDVAGTNKGKVTNLKSARTKELQRWAPPRW